MIISQLEKINRFTRRELTADEVYIFSVILCDNEIDRDCERFSDTALDELKKLFVGRTGIFDHDAKSSKQSARIFDTEIVTDSSRTTKNGEVYKYLKGHVYMVRTDDNRSLISEIDGGIKKEVSISCTASKRLCSVCGCDRAKNTCTHIRGKVYNGKLCHTVLSDITDAYEWSFVAVPAQVNAGVTKRFSDGNEVRTEGLQQGTADSAESELRSAVRRLAFVSGGMAEVGFAMQKAASMNAGQLAELKKGYELKNLRSETQIQLCTDCAEASYSDFSMK